VGIICPLVGIGLTDMSSMAFKHLDFVRIVKEGRNKNSVASGASEIL
jgi:hypothetical protein